MSGKKHLANRARLCQLFDLWFSLIYEWHVAVRCAYPATSRVRQAQINEKEAGALVLAIRWAARSRRTRRCRLVVQSDSAAAVCAMRKGRSYT